MGLTRSQQDAALAEIYAQIPVLPACDGRCWVSCGPIEMFDREDFRVDDRLFVLRAPGDLDAADERAESHRPLGAFLVHPGIGIGPFSPALYGPPMNDNQKDTDGWVMVIARSYRLIPAPNRDGSATMLIQPQGVGRRREFTYVDGKIAEITNG